MSRNQRNLQKAAKAHLQSSDALRPVVWPRDFVTGGVSHAPFSHIQPYLGYPGIPDSKGIKVVSWNVNGLRALQKTNVNLLGQLTMREEPQLLCLQETKLSGPLESLEELLPRYDAHYSCAVRKNYGGTAMFVKKGVEVEEVICGIPGVPDLSQEGRAITLVTPQTIVLNVYSPTSGKDLQRLGKRIDDWEPALSSYVSRLKAIGGKRNLLVVGSLNVAHEALDVHDPYLHEGKAGFTDKERIAFMQLLKETFMVDAFRERHPGQPHWHTHWPSKNAARQRNAGLRLDYVLVPRPVMRHLLHCSVLQEYHGSDHCPIVTTVQHNPENWRRD